MEKTSDWLQEVRHEAVTTGQDFYQLVAAKNLEVLYENVTKEQRDTVKQMLFAYTYGGSWKIKNEK